MKTKKKKNVSKKGPNFERSKCKQLSLWWTQDETEPHTGAFWRTANSGGRATIRAKQKLKTPNSYGDVGYLDACGKPFIDNCLLELKRGYTKDISILDLLDKKTGIPILLKWYNKAEEERKLAKRKYTIIIFRRDRHESCILLEKPLFGKIKDMFGTFKNDSIIINTKKHKFIVLQLNEFLDWCHPDFFRN